MHNRHFPNKGKKQFLLFVGNISVAVTAVNNSHPRAQAITSNPFCQVMGVAECLLCCSVALSSPSSGQNNCSGNYEA